MVQFRKCLRAQTRVCDGSALVGVALDGSVGGVNKNKIPSPGPEPPIHESADTNGGQHGRCEHEIEYKYVISLYLCVTVNVGKSCVPRW